MATVTIELQPQAVQDEFNLRRWHELLADPEMERIEGRIETNRHGEVIMSPPPAPSHGSYQTEIAYLLRTITTSGRVMTECPISTADGVRAADVAWASTECMKELGNRVCFRRAPEICVEVLSPRNRPAEIEDKKALFLDAGAKEIWLCTEDGQMEFFQSGGRRMANSNLCPKFPLHVPLR